LVWRLLAKYQPASNLKDWVAIRAPKHEASLKSGGSDAWGRLARLA
jgi:hypothetical protein